MKQPKTFILSDESVNSYGYRVLTSGIALEQFKRNPVMLYNHDDGKVIGRWDNIRIENGQLKADAVFDEEDDFAKSIAAKVEAGFLKGASLGFNIDDTSDAPKDMAEGQTRPTVTKSVAFEGSIVAMPGNLNALYDGTGNKLAINEATLNLLRLSKISQPIQSTDMKLSAKTLTALNLKLDSTESEVDAAVEKLSARADKAERELTELKQSQKAELKATAEKQVQALIDDKKATAAEKDELVELAMANPTAFGRLSAKLTAPDLPGGKTQGGGASGSFQLPEKMKGLSLREIEKLDNKVVTRMKKEAPDMYVELYEKQYGRKPAGK